MKKTLLSNLLKGVCCLVLFSLIFLYQAQLHAGTCTISSDSTQSQSDLETCAGGTLNNLIVDAGATLTLSGAITVNGDVTVNGSITHAAQDINGINITATNFILSNSGTLNVKGKGCPGSNSDGPYLTGYAPDPGPLSGTYKTCVPGVGGSGQGQYGGAGHGGTGGISYSAEGAVYDSVITPILLGAGGGGSNSGGSYGGGLVILNINGTTTIYGNITANAGGNGGGQGGGSGGTVYLNTDTLTGTGTISASGGNGDFYGAGGGGGRIAVYYNTNSGFDLSHITATGGSGYTDGKNGTTYIIDQTNDDLRVTSGLEFSSEGDYTRHSILIDSGANLYCSATFTTLNVSSQSTYTDNGSTWNCPTAIGTLNLSATGTLSITGTTWSITNTDQFNLTANTFTNSGTNIFTMSKAGSQSHWSLSNNLTLSNFTYTGANIGYSSYQGGVFFITDPIQVSLVNSNINSSVSWTGITSLNIDANSSINANAKGCSGSTGSPYLEGFGPNLLDTNYACASGDTTGVQGAGRPQYGGAGHCSAGEGFYGPPSTTYDTAAAPFLPGSGGGGGGTSMAIGGGTIRLSISGNLLLNGNLSANAGTASGQGGGSGGSVWVNASDVSGTGNVYANGMPGDGYGAPGGAGYIALYYDALDGFSTSQLQSNGVSGRTADCTPYTSLNPALDISPTSGLVTTESGGTATFTVALKTQPTSPVTVNLSSSNTSAGTVSPSTLTFPVSDWNIPQTVTITGVDGHIVGGSTPYSINITTSSSDSSYNNLSTSVSVSNTNDDTNPTLEVNDQSDTVTQGENSVTASFSLNMTPSQDVSVDYSTSDGTAIAGTDYVATSGTLVFPAGSSEAQNIEIQLLGDFATTSLAVSFNESVISKTLNINFSNAVNTELSAPSMVLTIVGTSQNGGGGGGIRPNNNLSGAGCILGETSSQNESLTFGIFLCTLIFLKMKNKINAL